MSHTFKQIAPTDHFGWHAGYMDVYERLFKTVDHNSILEIGCDGGGGILSYVDWFYRHDKTDPHRDFISCDISPRPQPLDLNKEILHYQGNAYSQEFIESMLRKHAPYSVIVEDGPHTFDSQVFFIQNYLQLLSPYGVAICEDIQNVDHIAKLHDRLPKDFVGYAVDLRWQDSRYDSLLFVAHRK